MSDTAPKLRKLRGSSRSASTDPSFLRSLIASAPLQEAPTTAMVEDVAKCAAPADTRPDAWDAHLAQLLHSMYLVSFTEKAQLGAMYSRNTGGNVAGAASTSSAAPADLARCSHSANTDARWLDAVTRYCRLTVTLDDVARVAMVFPALLQVRWAVVESDVRGAEGASFDESTHHNSSASKVGQYTDRASPSIRSTAAGGRLTARVYLAEHHVVSVEEATAQVKAAVREKGGPAAQRMWRALVNHQTAYSAYADSLLAAGGESSPPLTLSGSQPSAHAPTRLVGNVPIEAKVEDEDLAVEDEEKLCATLSAELRASLSAPKLRALLRQMRKDAAHVEEEEQHRIAQRQLQERLLNAYEHVRALYGPRDERGRSALVLITAMQRESRFEDALDIQALLSTLLSIPASGLSATILREGQVVVEPSAPVATAAKRYKRRRAVEEEEAEAPVVVRLSEPSLEPVSDLRGLTDAQLDLVLVRLDRTKASVKGVLEATA